MITVYHTESIESDVIESEWDNLGPKIRDTAVALAERLPLDLLDNRTPDGKIHIIITVYAS